MKKNLFFFQRLFELENIFSLHAVWVLEIKLNFNY
jgi:hypothetical protein